MKPFLIPDSNPFYRSLFKGTIFVLYRPLHYLPHLGSEELAECGPTTAPVSGFLKGLDRVLVGLGFGVWEFSVSGCRGSGFRGLGCCPDSVVATAAAAALLSAWHLTMLADSISGFSNSCCSCSYAPIVFPHGGRPAKSVDQGADAEWASDREEVEGALLGF